ncbi:MAG: DNA repair protein RecN [Bacillota bacterium]|nr:DNA repair protein RecN [Bacillota bacterium]
MLIALEINSFAIIDKMNISFTEGLNILTGETGAGKSIIVDAVNMLLGGRASGEFIRSGEEKALIAGVFFSEDPYISELLAEMGIPTEEDNTLILQREISLTGRNVCRINGSQVTLSMYRKIGPRLIDIYGQHEHHSLMNPDQHLTLVDLLAGARAHIIKHQVKGKFLELKSIKTKISEFQVNHQENMQKLDLWRYQDKELEAAQLKTGEEEQLLQDRKILSSYEKLADGVNEAHMTLNGSNGNNVRDQLAAAANQLSKIKEYDERLGKLSEAVDSCMYQIEDIAEELRGYQAELVYDPNRLEDIESRLAQLSNLKRKYGTASIEELIEYYTSLQPKIEELENIDHIIPQLEKDKIKLEEDYYRLASELSQIRKETAKALEKNVAKHLQELEMANTIFSVNFVENIEPTVLGIDKLEFLISPNLGEPVKPLVKIASGGELSRFMLALKAILAEVDNIPTLIFDEIDTGIGGQAVQAVAQKLASIGLVRQTVCVTHSPQIAGFATNHLHLEKKQKDGRVSTHIKILNQTERIEEIARMLTGNKITATTLQQAKEIMQNLG